MGRMKVETRVECYEVDGTETPVMGDVSIAVLSHWNRDNMVVLKLGSKSYTVVGSQLERAIRNATNVER